MALFLILTLAPAALGQSSMSMSVYRASEYFSPELTARDLAVIARVLELGDAEREALLTLHGGYVQALKERGDAVDAEMQDRIEKAQAIRDVATAQPTEAETTRWKSEGKAIGASFFDDLKSLLSREQSDRWPLAERELRRYKRIGSGRLYGESIDIIRLVEEVVPEAWRVPGVSDILAAYADAMDSALKLRDEAVDQPKFEEMNTLAKTDMDGAKRIWDEAKSRRVAARELNRRTGEQVAALLTPESAAKLRLAILERSFPTLSMPSRSEKFIRAAAALKSLTPAQRTEVADITGPFERSYNVIIQDAAAAMLEKEDRRLPAALSPEASGLTVATTASGETISFMSSNDLKADPNDPMTDIKRRRYELGRDTRRKIESVLSAEQRAACTDPPADNLFFYGDDVIWGL